MNPARMRSAQSVRSLLVPAAVGLHAGLLVMCASAVYTDWQLAIVTWPQWVVMLGVAGALAAGAFTGGAMGLQRTWVRLVLALAGLLCFKLCWKPQLADIPRLGERLPLTFADTYPSMALIGIAIILISWFAHRSGGGERTSGVVPMRWSVLLASGLLMLLTAVAYIILRREHDIPPSAALRPVLMAAQGGCLATVLLSTGGAPRVGRAPHLYLAAALVLAFVRNMAFPPTE